MKYLITLLLTVLTVGAAYQPDLRPGLDPTGKTNITAAQLYQMVQFAQPGTNKGFIIRTNNLPDIVTYPRYTNYIWLDLSGSSPAMKCYFGNGVDNTSTNWIASAVGSGTVQTASIADGAVTSVKLAVNAVNTTNIANNAVDGNKIAALSINNSHLNAGIVSNVNIATRTIQGGFSGQIAVGTITHTNIGDGEITTGKLADGSVTSNKLAAGAVNISKLSIGTTSNQFLMTGATDTNATWRSWALVFESVTNGVPTSSSIITNAHSLGAVPQQVRWVLVNASTDLGYAVGDELPVTTAVNTANGNPAAQESANATAVYLSCVGSAWSIRERDGAGTNTITKANWRLKVYATRTGG